MSQYIPELFLWSALAIALYAALSRGLFLATDEARQSLVDLCAPLLESEQLSKQHKRALTRVLDSVHGTWAAWKLVYTAVIVMITSPFAREAHAKRIDSIDNDVPPMLRCVMPAIRHRWIIATLGNSFAATVLFSLILFVTVAFCLPANSFVRALASRRDEHGHGRGATA